jgi:hypothetical protein
MSDPDDELKQISDQASAEANYIPDSPIEKMIADALGIKAAMNFRESVNLKSKQDKRQELTSRISSYAGRFFAIYTTIWLMVTVSRLTWIWLF